MVKDILITSVIFRTKSVYDNNGNRCDSTWQWITITNCGGVGIDENDISKQIKIFPNPVENSMTIEVGEFGKESFNLVLSDVLGREVYRELLHHGNATIQRKNWPAGIYMLTLTNGKYKAHKKLIFK